MTNETLPFSVERIEAERAAYQRWQKRRDEAIKSAAVMEISEGISLALLFNPMFERAGMEAKEQVNDILADGGDDSGGLGLCVGGDSVIVRAPDSGYSEQVSDRWGRVNHITFYLFVPAILLYFAGACCMPSLVPAVALVAGLVAIVGGYAAWRGWMPV